MAVGGILLGINRKVIASPANVGDAAVQHTRGWSMYLLRMGQKIRLRFRL
jgi:hypothetical protein